MKSLVILLIIVLSMFYASSAQDILGGEIRYAQSIVDPNSYQVEVFLYSRTSLGIPHNGTATNLPNDITEWHQVLTHAYPGPGTYDIIVTDSFRISGIDNIINSSIEKITLKAQLEINPFNNGNTSAIFNKKQTELYTDGINIYHDASAIDLNGDSLVYSLVPASSTNYTAPPGATIVPVTGLFQMPIHNDIYAINIEVQELRNGILVGTTYREMSIDGSTVTTISEMDNNDEFIIYPNPTTGIVNLKSEMELELIIIYDMLGKEVDRFENPDKIIDLRNNRNGIYLIRIKDDKNRIFLKSLIKE